MYLSKPHLDLPHPMEIGVDMIFMDIKRHANISLIDEPFQYMPVKYIFYLPYLPTIEE
jgi:hypothetical protein